MNPRRRMFRTLGGLAVAMTGTAGFLAWSDPSLPVADTELSSVELSEWASALVVEDVELASRAWREVEIVADRSPTMGTLLAAEPASNDAHFYVDPLGRLSRGASWDRQTPGGGGPHTIRIKVSLPSDSQRVSHRQWTGVQALLQALDATGVSPVRPVPVRVGFKTGDRSAAGPTQAGLISQVGPFAKR